MENLSLLGSAFLEAVDAEVESARLGTAEAGILTLAGQAVFGDWWFWCAWMGGMKGACVW